MNTPLFLDLYHVLRIHQTLIEQYGGEEGTRDIGLLQSAIAMPQVSYEGHPLHEDIFEMAAAYAYHIIQNHPFLDGNKRTGSAAAIVFLAMNNIQIQNDEEGLVEIMLAVASGQAGKREIAEFFLNRVLD